MKLTSRSNSKGAIFIELVVSLPIVLLLVAAIIFVSELVNAVGQLKLAVSEGPRLAVTRGNATFFTSGSINTEIENYINNRNGDLPRILYLNVDKTVAKGLYGTASTQWHKRAADGDPVYQISQAHPIDVYALAYTYGILRLGIPGIKYPCNPDSSTARDGSGCVYCQIASPLPLTGESCPSTNYPACPFDRVIPEVGVICKYHPAGQVSKLVDNLIRFFSRGNGGLPDLFLTASTYPPGAGGGSQHGGDL